MTGAHFKSGLACTQMIFQWLKYGSIDDLEHLHIGGDSQPSTKNAAADQENTNEKTWMLDFVQTESIWTIDLLVLLQHVHSYTNNIINATRKEGTTDGRSESTDKTECVHSCCQKQSTCPHQVDSFPLRQLASSWSYLFCSTKFGVDESYTKLGYYKDAFASDEHRVKDLFDMAQKQNLPLLQTSHLSLEVLVEVVARKNVVAIVLLDNRILRDNNTSPTSSYSGHYVIVCGISTCENDVQYAQINDLSDREEDSNHNFCMVLKNPGVWKQTEYVTPSRFEKAWRATGTDEDVIFVAKHSE